MKIQLKGVKSKPIDIEVSFILVGGQHQTRYNQYWWVFPGHSWIPGGTYYFWWPNIAKQKLFTKEKLGNRKAYEIYG